MYKVVKDNSDTVPVPQIVFSKLCVRGAQDSRFRVILYALMQGEFAAPEAAAALHLPVTEVEKALEYWEGAGLLEPQRSEMPAPAMPPPQRRRLSTQQAAQAAKQDATLAGLYGELQRIFGGVVSQSDYNIFSTLYVEDHFPADLILIAASHSAALGKYSARYIEKMLLSWRREGIETSADADAYLCLLQKRQKFERDIAKMLGIDADALTLAERRKIDKWDEEYGYGRKMVEAARLAADDKEDDIAYLNGILKKWFGKGYKTPRDVEQSEENHNIRVSAPRTAVAPQEDIMANTQGYVPLQTWREEN